MTESDTRTNRLLAIDDHVDSAELITRVAASCGFEVQAATDLKNLPELLASWGPDVITLDLCMPGTDGIEVLSLLKQADFNGQLIIVSGQDDALREISIRLARARDLKIASSMQKPVNLRALRRELVRLMAG